jgi:hypothetical protein
MVSDTTFVLIVTFVFLAGFYFGWSFRDYNSIKRRKNMDLIKGTITGRGPVKTAPYPNGADIAFFDYDGTTRPNDLAPSIPFLHALPMAVVVDMDRLSKNWVPFSPQVEGKEAWLELPRFTPGEEPPEPPTTGKSYKIELTVTGTITEIN